MGGAGPSGGLGLVPRGVTGHLSLVMPHGRGAEMKETKSRAVLPERVEGTDVDEETVGECRGSYRSIEKLPAVSGDTEVSLGKGCLCRDWKELIGQGTAFQTEGTLRRKGEGGAEAHVIFRKAVVIRR